MRGFDIAGLLRYALYSFTRKVLFEQLLKMISNEIYRAHFVKNNQKLTNRIFAIKINDLFPQ